MTIDLIHLLKNNYELLIFVTLGLGLIVGKITICSFHLGSSIGVLLVALLFGQMGFSLPDGLESAGFMLFIFCVGIEAGPHFFSVFARDGKRYVILALVLTVTALVVNSILSRWFDFDQSLSAGIFAGSLTSTPALAGAQEVLRHLSALPNMPNTVAFENSLSISYALTYLTGLVGLMLVVRYLPIILRLDLPEQARTLARERGVDDEENRKVYLPIIRAYRVSAQLCEFFGGQNLRNIGIYRRTGCYIERIRRNGILAKPDGDAVLQEGDEVALLGYPESHERLNPLFRNDNEVFDRDLLDLQITTEEIVVKNDRLVGQHISDLNLTDYGCFLNRVIRSQIAMPLERDILLNKGDVLQISGEQHRIEQVAERIGFINIRSRITDLVSFSLFFVIGLILAQISIKINVYELNLGNAVGLLLAGIMMGYLRAMHPTIGHVPQAALRLIKDLGLLVFMVGLGLSAGHGLFGYLAEYGPTIIISGFLVSIVPVLVCYLFGRVVLRMNPALLLGAITGARTSAPAMETVNDLANSSIPSLGYVGTYAVANVLFTIAGSIIMMWP